MRLQTYQNLSRLSRDRSFLLRTSLVIMSLACCVGWLISLVTSSYGLKPKVYDARSDGYVFAELIKQKDDLDAKQIAHWIRNANRIMMMLSSQPTPDISVGGLDNERGVVQRALPLLENIISTADLDESDRMLLLNLAHALYDKDKGSETALENLKQSAAMDPPVRYANEFYADALFTSSINQYAEALKHYLVEIHSFEGTDYAKKQIFRIAIHNKSQSELKIVTADPDYKNLLDTMQKIDVAIILRDWFGLAKAVIQYDYERSSIGRYLLSFFAGGIWMMIIGQFAGFSRRQIILYITAIALGIISASLTLFVVVLQDEIRGFGMGDELWHQLSYCIAGIGLREESIKLLLFVLLIPFLLRRSEIESLVVASFVGLGFAMQENIGYYLGESFSPWSRFFSANFLHLSLTGILGLALMQFCRWPKSRWEELLATFIAVVVIHGLYDALIMIPELSGELGIFTLLILSVMAYRYFDQAEHLAATSRRSSISPLAIFVLGAALLGGMVMIVSCWGIPFRLALISFLNSGLGVFAVIFIFINRFRDA